MLSGHKKRQTNGTNTAKNKTKMGPVACASLEYSEYGPLYVKFSTNTVQFIVFCYKYMYHIHISVLQNTRIWPSLYPA